MRTLKVTFYDNPKRTKHRCTIRTQGVSQFSKEELQQAIELMQLARKHR